MPAATINNSCSSAPSIDVLFARIRILARVSQQLAPVRQCLGEKVHAAGKEDTGYKRRMEGQSQT